MLKLGFFSIDGDPANPTWQGYYNLDHSWNGWLNPKFTHDVASKLVAADSDEGDDRVGYNEAEDTFYYGYDDLEDCKGQVYQTVDGDLKLYGIGSSNYCWDLVDDPIPSNTVYIEKAESEDPDYKQLLDRYGKGWSKAFDEAPDDQPTPTFDTVAADPDRSAAIDQLREKELARAKKLFFESLDMGARGSAKTKRVIRHYGLTDQQRQEFRSEWSRLVEAGQRTLQY